MPDHFDNKQVHQGKGVYEKRIVGVCAVSSVGALTLLAVCHDGRVLAKASLISNKSISSEYDSLFKVCGIERSEEFQLPRLTGRDKNTIRLRKPLFRVG